MGENRLNRKGQDTKWDRDRVKEKWDREHERDTYMWRQSEIHIGWDKGKETKRKVDQRGDRREKLEKRLEEIRIAEPEPYSFGNSSTGTGTVFGIQFRFWVQGNEAITQKKFNDFFFM
jgi:hypothetical protein